MRVIGTAGHVDHGKSALVRALTGIDPDRLREEQERQMTIDLGFAWMSLPGGEEVGIVDVPGHRDFIENMLAGVTGIDAALLVVAADEGVMPQTREHLAILDLLEISRAVVCLTKIDLVEDAGWLTLVSDEVRELLASTRLASAPIVPVSAVRGEGLDNLRVALAEALREAPVRQDVGRPRLPIDRAFTIAGFGTVVTGTLSDGSLVAGQEVTILPDGHRARIRSLQTHKAKVERAIPGSRTAANLVGVEVGDLERGDVVTIDDSYRATRVLDVRFRLLADSPGPLRHDQEVKLFLGSAQRVARVRLLGADEIVPGTEGWLQLVLDEPTVAARGDHFILRRPSPGSTLGGGRVVDANPARLHRRMNRAVLENLQRQAKGTPGEVLGQAIEALAPVMMRAAVEKAGLSKEAAREAIVELERVGRLTVLGEGSVDPQSETIVTTSEGWQELIRRMQHVLSTYHAANPLRSGIPREELKSRMKMDSRVFSAAIETASRQGLILDRGQRLSLPEHQVHLTREQRARAEALRARFRASPFSPPSVKECLEELGEELWAHLLETGEFTQLTPEVVLESSVYDSMVREIRQRLASGGTLTVAQVRDQFNTSRKYALALMEHLDAIGVTVREGDVRRLARSAAGDSRQG
jgi:selenocysteine-specific elongation factor